MVMLSFFESKFARGWPEYTDGKRQLLPAWDLFTRAFGSDAHFAPYVSDTPYRLTIAATGLARVSVRALVVDLDAPDHTATPDWRKTVARVCAGLPGAPFGYHTRGGARLVWALETPYPIDTRERAREWSEHYTRCLVTIVDWLGRSIAGAYVPDPTCRDWTRLFRAPHATRDGELQALGWVCGEPTAIGLWTDAMSAAYDARTHARLARRSPVWGVGLAAPQATQARAVARSSSHTPQGASPAQNGVSVALARADWAIREAPKGTRNRTLYAQARFLFSIVTKGELSADQAREHLTHAASAAGLDAVEIARTIASAFKN